MIRVEPLPTCTAFVVVLHHPAQALHVLLHNVPNQSLLLGPWFDVELGLVVAFSETCLVQSDLVWLCDEIIHHVALVLHDFGQLVLHILEVLNLFPLGRFRCRVGPLPPPGGLPLICSVRPFLMCPFGLNLGFLRGIGILAATVEPRVLAGQFLFQRVSSRLV